jgi:hypothetical protein
MVRQRQELARQQTDLQKAIAMLDERRAEGEARRHLLASREPQGA